MRQAQLQMTTEWLQTQLGIPEGVVITGMWFDNSRHILTLYVNAHESDLTDETFEWNGRQVEMKKRPEGQEMPAWWPENDTKLKEQFGL